MSLTFICENAGTLKLKEVPPNKLSRLKNPRLVFSATGIQLHVQFKYRSGDWTLTAGGMFEIWPYSTGRTLLNILRAIQTAEGNR